MSGDARQLTALRNQLKPGHLPLVITNVLDFQAGINIRLGQPFQEFPLH